eukprot:CAMPEP_0205824626 /NCGR_PEP_ID=MMETSP0206-20130828/21852_1 /ASSEMBLY_ACC=CAM_ASM_000279 /TAXON_ID=36767 /ORGANISM="Euplotes focardii, Strain TN1" /LENGTH=48 /DNA_ID= /DNA_START= /DNA_END= /DNA_ORIENTATION=
MEREEARKVKDWTRADALRDEVRAKGVEIFDKQRQWRYDGRTFDIGAN